MSLLPPSPGQTVGPFFGYALPYPGGSELVAPGRPGAVQLHGVVRDGAGDPVPDALIEIWQTDPDGNLPRTPGSLRRNGFSFTGFGRAETDLSGHYSFSTLRPGALDAQVAPFWAVVVFARGLTDRLHTRAYLPADTEARRAALVADRLLQSIEPERRGTLVTAADADGYIFDIRLQGEDETVFLAHGGAA